MCSSDNNLFCPLFEPGVFFVYFNCICLCFVQIHARFNFNYIIYYYLLIFCCQNAAKMLPLQIGYIINRFDKSISIFSCFFFNSILKFDIMVRRSPNHVSLIISYKMLSLAISLSSVF